MANKVKEVLIIQEANNPIQQLQLNEKATSKLGGYSEKIKNGEWDKKYLMGGIFTEFDKENENKRIYTANHFLPKLKEMLEEKTRRHNVLMGELDHPESFDTSLARASHLVLDAYYNEAYNRVDGKIYVLTSPNGMAARSFINDGVPIFVSSRAAGTVNEDGTVSINRLFTYDLVATPGFADAKMGGLVDLNESRQYHNNPKVHIFDIDSIRHIGSTSLRPELAEQSMKEYNQYIDTEIQKEEKNLMSQKNTGSKMQPKASTTRAEARLNELRNNQQAVNDYLKKLSKSVNQENTRLNDKSNLTAKKVSKIAKVVTEQNNYVESIAGTVNKLIDHTDNLVETFEQSDVEYQKNIQEIKEQNQQIISYLNDLAQAINEMDQETTDYTDALHLKVDKSIAYSEKLAGHIQDNINENRRINIELTAIKNHSNYLAENLDYVISYADDLSGDSRKLAEFTDYLALTLDKNFDYTEKIAEDARKLAEYTNYLAGNQEHMIEHLDYLAENQERIIEHSDYLAEYTEYALRYSEYIKNKLNESIGYSEFMANRINEAIGYTEYTSEQTKLAFKYLKEGRVIDVDNDGRTIHINETALGGSLNEGVGTSSVMWSDGKNGSNWNADQTILTSSKPSKDNNPEIGKGDYIYEFVTEQVAKVINISQATFEVETLTERTKYETPKQHVNLILKASTLTEELKNKKAKKLIDPNLSFINLFNSEQRRAFFGLTESQRLVSIKAIEKSEDCFNGNQVVEIINNALNEQENETSQKVWEQRLLDKMPDKLKPIWNKLDEKRKQDFLQRSEWYDLKTLLDVEDFWNSLPWPNLILTTVNEEQNVTEIDLTVSGSNDELSDNELNSLIGRFERLDGGLYQ